jgi:hypothetical protein
MKEIAEIARKVKDLLKTNNPIIMTEKERRTHVMKITCDLCKCIFSNKKS